MIVQDKVAIVTGASSGIGQAVSQILADHGARVVLVARTRDKLQELSNKLPGSYVIAADLQRGDEVRQMIEETVRHFGRLDILVNNAGRGYDSYVENIDPSIFRDLFELNVVSPIIAMQSAIPVMRKRGEGSIVNISSGTSFMNIPNLSAYSSVKRALNGVSLTAREELRKDNIIVSLVYPYITDTNFGKNMMGKPRENAPVDADNPLPPPDSATYIAEKVLEAIESGEAEILAHDWMRDIK